MQLQEEKGKATAVIQVHWCRSINSEMHSNETLLKLLKNRPIQVISYEIIMLNHFLFKKFETFIISE